MYSMRVKSVMERKKLLVAPPGTTVAKAAKLMVKKNVGAVMVVAEKRLVGIFTDRDSVFRVIAAGRDPVTAESAAGSGNGRLVARTTAAPPARMPTTSSGSTRRRSLGRREGGARAARPRAPRGGRGPTRPDRLTIQPSPRSIGRFDRCQAPVPPLTLIGQTKPASWSISAASWLRLPDAQMT